MRQNAKTRPAATVIELAVVGPITFLLLLGLLIGGMGIFRYQEVASLAREASRWASVHGTQYQKDTGYAAATEQDVYNNVIAPNAFSLDKSKLTYSVTWPTGNSPYHTNVDSTNNKVVAVTNMVTVTVTYHWVPEAYLGGITLTSTSTVPMSE